jgi:hypothetical protein
MINMTDASATVLVRLRQSKAESRHSADRLKIFLRLADNTGKP